MRRTRYRAAARGVTLIEVLIVVAIMATLSAMVGIAVYKHKVEADQKLARTGAHAVLEAAEFALANETSSECPTVGQLQEKRVLRRGAAVDPWKQGFKISCESADSIVVSSAGRDRRFGTEDDIRVPPSSDS